VRELAVLLEHLRRVAARSAVDPVELLTALLAIVTTAATPTVVVAIITIVIQGLLSSKPRTVSESPCHMHGVRDAACRSITVRFSNVVIPTSAESQLPRRDHLQMLESNRVWENPRP
jgi:uncharacterized membrane protein